MTEKSSDYVEIKNEAILEALQRPEILCDIAVMTSDSSTQWALVLHRNNKPVAVARMSALQMLEFLAETQSAIVKATVQMGLRDFVSLLPPRTLLQEAIKEHVQTPEPTKPTEPDSSIPTGTIGTTASTNIVDAFIHPHLPTTEGTTPQRDASRAGRSTATPESTEPSQPIDE